MAIEVKTDSFGTTRHFLNGALHRDDGPAVIYSNGILEYCQFGVLHRDRGPAMIYPRDGVPGDVDEYWYFLGELHRDDGPAVISKDEHTMWYNHGKLHRTGGPAIVSHLTGAEHWYKDGERHRQDGPAVTLRTGEKRYFWYGIEYSELPKDA